MKSPTMRTTLPSPAVLRPTGHRYRRVLVLDQVGRLIGFVTTYPVNWWLIRHGIKDVT
jgi:hypothetical protein